MNRAGSPGAGRKKASAQDKTGASKKPVDSKPARAAAKTAKTVKAALGKAGTAAGGLAKKLTKNVTSITKKIVAKAEKVANPAKGEKPSAKAPAKPVAKAPAKAPAKTPVTAPVKPAAKPTVKSGAKPAAKAPSAKSPAKPVAKKPAAKKEPARTAPKTPPVKDTTKAPAKAPVKVPRPSRTLRPKKFGELETARGFGFPEETPELPAAYGEDRLVLMTKDPEYLFAYWEITPERRAEGERAKQSGQEYREALRLNWTSGDLLADSFALIPVSLDAGRWYLRVPFSGLSYYIEIGWLSAQGHFISLLESSNASDAPESWAATRERLRDRDGAVLEYSLSAAQPLGSSESARPAAAASKRPATAWNYEGPGAQSSSDAARKTPPAETARPSRSAGRTDGTR